MIRGGEREVVSRLREKKREMSEGGVMGKGEREEEYRPERVGGRQ